MVKIVSDPKIVGHKNFNCVDMHHHSTASDGKYSPQFLAQYFIKKKVGLCITDHNRIKGSMHLQQYPQLFTIPSIEVSSKQSKDVLAYFRRFSDLEAFWKNEVQFNINDNWLLNLNRTTIDLFDLLEKIHDYSGIAVLAHPLALPPKTSWQLLLDKEFLKRIDGIETHNYLTGHFNEMIKFAGRFDKTITAGSDSHILSPLTTLTVARDFKRDDFLETLLKRKHSIYAQKTSFFGPLKEKMRVLSANVRFRRKTVSQKVHEHVLPSQG